MVKVAIDLLGGDKGFEVIVEGVIDALNEIEFKPVLVGSKELFENSLPLELKSKSLLVECSDYIKMEESATEVLKRKDSSIYKCMEMLKNKEVDSVLSAGHSGATMSIATLKAGRIKGVLRPAIASYMPTTKGRNSIIIDAGANVDCKPEHLLQFAIMGREYVRRVFGISSPKIGLLSNGEEKSKGDELTKESHQALSIIDGFIGNVEGGNIFDGSVDVIVCDGFVGNIVLKTSEGVADAIISMLKSDIENSIISKIGALLLKPVFKNLKKRIDYAEYGGAPLLGVDGNVIICHGKSNAKAIKNGILQAIKNSELDVNSLIEEEIGNSSKKTQKIEA